MYSRADAKLVKLQLLMSCDWLPFHGIWLIFSEVEDGIWKRGLGKLVVEYKREAGSALLVGLESVMWTVSSIT